jgi:hypothetical protein
MRPWRGVSSGESARWCDRGPGRVRRHLGQLGMKLRELLMAETTAFGVGVDPARITLAAGRLLSGASCDRDEQVTVPQPWKWNRPPGMGRGRPEPAFSLPQVVSQHKVRHKGGAIIVRQAAPSGSC